MDGGRRGYNKPEWLGSKVFTRRDGAITNQYQINYYLSIPLNFDLSTDFYFSLRFDFIL